MRANKLFFTFLLMGSAVSAQVIITPDIPGLGLVIKSQLWNMGIINSGNQPIQAEIQVLVTDISNNQRVFSGTSKPIILSKGLTQITPNNAAPIIYNVFNSAYGVTTSPDGFLPLGRFDVCYSINAITAETMETVANDCENVEISPISPPSLISPADSEKMELTRPLFIWLPPEPYNLLTNLTFSFTLVEVLPTQDGAQAIQENVPIYNATGISTVSLQYPLSLPALDTAKRYAWQVGSNSGESLVSKSEIWVFMIEKPVIGNTGNVSQDYFIRLKRNIDGGFNVCKGILKYAYYNESNTGSVKFNLYDLSSASRARVQLDSSELRVKFGENYNKLDFTEGTSLSNRHIYLLEVINNRAEHWYLKFEYLKP